ncbi:hypothetical protein [Bifidobacterium thermophilum]|uniref:hypothetical protein n=1 Tax=Bifidobacterium thermophilum TaxID=33905 RepID=UPI00309E3F02
MKSIFKFGLSQQLKRLCWECENCARINLTMRGQRQHIKGEPHAARTNPRHHLRPFARRGELATDEARESLRTMKERTGANMVVFVPLGSKYRQRQQHQQHPAA